MTDLALRGASLAWLRLRSFDRVWLAILLIATATALLAPSDAPEVFSVAIGSFVSTLPFIAVAVAMVALLKATGAEAIVARAFQGNETRMIVMAALVGGLAPFCSCQVIPFIAGLLALGAPVSAVMAFWLSSPLMDPASFMIAAGALGWTFAIGKAVTAVGIGLAGGMFMAGAMRAGFFASPVRPDAPIGGCGCGSGFNGRPVWRFWTEEKRRRTFADQSRSNALFLIKWLALAYLLEGLMIRFIPAEAVGALAGGDGPVPILVGALVGMPAYLNGYAAPPLVAALMAQGMSPGAAMAFLSAGAVSCIPAMAAVWSLVRLPIFAAYVALGLGGAVLAGAIFSLVV